MKRLTLNFQDRLITDTARREGRYSSVMDWLIPVGALALWWGLQVWILPRLGVPT